MASKKKDASEDNKKGYQPKATARHAKIVKTKKEETEALKQRIETDKYLAKKYESNRKTEIKALPKEERAEAKAELKESVAKRKETEKKDREKLRNLQSEEKTERKNLGKEPFDEDTSIEGGRKKSKGKERQETPEEPTSEPEPIQTEDRKKED
jgi:hypothetical protein